MTRMCRGASDELPALPSGIDGNADFRSVDRARSSGSPACCIEVQGWGADPDVTADIDGLEPGPACR